MSKKNKNQAQDNTTPQAPQELEQKKKQQAGQMKNETNRAK